MIPIFTPSEKEKLADGCSDYDKHFLPKPEESNRETDDKRG